ncbi:hypothetical protein IQ241_20265 [Romeria aff. gracilis LEGE 07310]|uniref:Uncharacterized protein n=1 Tax=Vasconcelosia minhoensis LEGE 07310 TaxID=915328 RepID=A0A8J7AKV6_9CYAN|nr:hypothetical protein [Romeria gracilis]MBE9079603.1 hypothetical protein [Romeria aff. gracilis LEGE 07310]
MEPFLIVSNLLLVAVTGTYAWLAHKTTRQRQQEGDFYRSAIERQLQITAMPHLYWDLRLAETDQTLTLDVFNISSVPAYDVHISLIGAYTEEALDIASFMRSYVQPRYRKYPLQSDQVGYYGIRSALRLSLLPAQQKISLALPFPLLPVDVYTLVQYRELSGENYYQVCCFSALDESGAYRANILEPTETESMDRLHLFDPENFELPEAKQAWPYYLADFIDLWNHALSSRLTVATPLPEHMPVKAGYDF